MNKEKRLATLSLVFFSVVSLLSIILPVSPVMRGARAVLAFSFIPIIEKTDSLSFYLTDVPKNVLSMLNTQEENYRLQKEVQDARIAKVQLASMMEENKRLSQLLGLAESWKWTGVWARVIERDPTRWQSVFMVNKGLRDGVSLNSAVLGVHGDQIGLVGKIIEVAQDNSKVLLTTDPMFSATCVVKDSQSDGLVEGQGTSFLKLNYMPLEAKIEDGAELVTSPSSAVFPPGIPVGKILRFYPKEIFMTFTSAEVIPAVKPGTVKEVFIIRGERK